MEQVLSDEQIRQFITEGYVRIDHAFSRETADEALDILWNELPVDRHGPATWTEPVIRLGMFSQKPFAESINTPVLHAAFDQLVGAGNWMPRESVGTFPVRFPSQDAPGDDGWHVDASFPGEEPADYFKWRINVRSRGRALLMLFLYSDVGENDAPTRIRKGSHQDVARLLAGAGDAGMAFMELAGALDTLPKRNETLATGAAGTVYLCHPFLAHAAQPHRGENPKFMAQPSLELTDALRLEGEVHYPPVAQAIRQAIF